MSTNMKWLVGALVLIPVLLHLGYAAYASPMANYYIGIDQYVIRSANTPVRIGGTVAPGTIRYDNASRTMRFTVTGENSKIEVTYRGAVPDAFRDGVTAILEGARANDGSYAATALSVKCPHQYLPAGW
jgi:cytochrome c-type biogenesis protein CcmE